MGLLRSLQLVAPRFSCQELTFFFGSANRHSVCFKPNSSEGWLVILANSNLF